MQILVELSFEKVKNVSSFAIHILKKMRSRLCSQERWNPELVNAFGAAARYRRATAAAVMMTRTRIIRHSTRVKFTLFRCTSAELFFSCCDSVSAPRQRPGHHDQVPAKNNERRRWHRLKHHDEVPAMHSERRHGQRPSHHDQVPRDAQLAPPRETAWEPRLTTCAAPRATAGRNDEVPSTHNERCRGQWPGHHDK